MFLLEASVPNNDITIVNILARTPQDVCSKIHMALCNFCVRLCAAAVGGNQPDG